MNPAFYSPSFTLTYALEVAREVAQIPRTTKGLQRISRNPLFLMAER